MTAVCQLCAENQRYQLALYCVSCMKTIREWSRCPDCLSGGEITIHANRPGITSLVRHSPTCPMFGQKRIADATIEIRHIEGNPQP